MSSLARCLKKLNLSEHEAAILRGSVDEYTAEGYQAHEAAEQAIKDMIEDAEQEREDIVEQVIAAAEKAPATKQDGQQPRRMNMTHTLPVSELLTPGGALKASATRGKRAPWYHQGDPGRIQFSAKVTFGGKPPAAEAVQEWENLKAAKEKGRRAAGYF